MKKKSRKREDENNNKKIMCTYKNVMNGQKSINKYMMMGFLSLTLLK